MMDFVNTLTSILALDRSPVFYMIIGVACFLVGLSKGGLGGTMGFLITPMVTMVLPLNQAVGLLLPILILGDAFALTAYWRRWDWRHVKVLLIGGLVGVTLATFILTNVSAEILKKGLGAMVLAFVLYRLFEQRILGGLRYQSRRWHAIAAGSLAGFTSTLAHAGGPPITIYLLMQQLKPVPFIATSALFFALLNWIKVPYYYFTGLFDFRLLWSLIWLLPFIPLGVWAGRVLVRRINKTVFDWVIVGLLLVSGLVLLR